MTALPADGWVLGHRPGLDQLRGTSVALVLLGHAAVGTPLGFASSVGVCIFFVLSGFLITRLLIEEHDRTARVDIRGFYARRVRRLVPALVLALGLSAGVNAALGHPVLLPLLGALTYTSNYVVETTDAGAFVHLWSLAVEEHMYVVWPVLVAAVPRRFLVLLASVAVPSIGAWRAAVAAVDPSAAYHSTHLRLDAMLVGALLAVVAARLGRPSRALVAAAVALLLTFVASAPANGWLGWELSLVIVAAGVLVWAATSEVRRRPALERLGVVSYGVYLFHLPVALLIRQVTTAPVAVLLGSAVASIALAEASYRLVENRFRLRSSGSPARAQPALV